MKAFTRHTVFKKTMGSVFILAVYMVVTNEIQHLLHHDVEFPDNVNTLFGAALSILMVLRTNSAYDRWWEGRKLWGQLVNDSRNLALKIKTLADVPEADKYHAGRFISGFCLCLRDHLRGGVLPETEARLPEELPKGLVHVPAYLSQRLFETTRKWRDDGQIFRFDHQLIDRHISALMDICGACERILNTPLPLSHRALIPQLLLAYLVVMPIGMSDNPWNVLVVCGVGYFMIGLEVVAEEIEEPFGCDPDDLPLDMICRNIGRSVNQILPEPAAAPVTQTV